MIVKTTITTLRRKILKISMPDINFGTIQNLRKKLIKIILNFTRSRYAVH